MANATVNATAVLASTLAGGDAGGGAFIVSLDLDVPDEGLALAAAEVPQPIIYQPYDTWRPRFSPDGQVMLVCRTSPGDHDTDLTNMTLWAFPPEGWNGGDQVAKVKDLPGNYGWDSYGHPEWAPDSESVVICAETASTWQIVQLDSLEYNTLAVLYEVTKPDTVSDPSFMPNGDVVFVALIGGLYQILRIANLATPVLELIYSSNDPLADPMVSPDGNTIVWAEQVNAPDMSHPFGQWDLYGAAVDGTNVQPVLSDGNAHQHPSFLSPRFLLFQTFRYGTDSVPHVARIRVNGVDHLVLGEGEYPIARKV